MEQFVLDASYVLSEILPDEQNHEVNTFFISYEHGGIELIAPTLLPYEMTNAISVAVRQRRLNQDQANYCLDQFNGLHIELISPDISQILDLCRTKNLTCYDASYLLLAEEYGVELLTLDKKLLALSKKRK